MLLRTLQQEFSWTAMAHDYIEDELSRRTVFKSEQFLSIDYVPESLPHRQVELRTLAQNFKTLHECLMMLISKQVIECIYIGHREWKLM